jgi:hypothetical protein
MRGQYDASKIEKSELFIGVMGRQAGRPCSTAYIDVSLSARKEGAADLLQSIHNHLFTTFEASSLHHFRPPSVVKDSLPVRSPSAVFHPHFIQTFPFA